MDNTEWYSRHKKLSAVLILIAFIVGALTGYYISTSHRPGDYSHLSADELQDDIDVYRLCMQTGGRTGCTMSIDNFAVYQDLKREQVRREEERANLKAYSEADR